jgi:uncharacterized membrane protein
MGTLTVWKFETATGADDAERTLLRLSEEGVITGHDAATVTWEVGKKKPKTRQLSPTAAGGALGGSFWGLPFGMIFLVPLIGAAVGAATGALAGSPTDVGIDDDVIKRVREQVTPGTSALFLLVRRGDRPGARHVRRGGEARAHLHQLEQRPGGRAARGLR